jgi:hypothetical protein
MVVGRYTSLSPGPSNIKFAVQHKGKPCWHPCLIKRVRVPLVALDQSGAQREGLCRVFGLGGPAELSERSLIPGAELRVKALR